MNISMFLVFEEEKIGLITNLEKNLSIFFSKTDPCFSGQVFKPKQLDNEGSFTFRRS